MTIEEKSEVRKVLKKGDHTLIANAAGCTREAVSAFLIGTSTNSYVEPFVMEMYKKRKQEHSEALAEFKKAI